MVAVSEADIQRLRSWPFTDDVVAHVVGALLALQPRAVGLDIYRDVPVPPGTAALEALLKSDRRVVAVTKFGEGASTGVPPPAVLKGSEQVGFNDILVDPGGVVRRGFLFLDDGLPNLHRRADIAVCWFREVDWVGDMSLKARSRVSASTGSPGTLAPPPWSKGFDDEIRHRRRSLTTADSGLCPRRDASSIAGEEGPAAAAERPVRASAAEERTGGGDAGLQAAASGCSRRSGGRRYPRHRA